LRSRTQKRRAIEIAEKNGQVQKMAEEIKLLRDPTKRQFLAFLAQLEGEINNAIPQHWSHFIVAKSQTLNTRLL